MKSTSGRISLPVFKGICGTLFGLSIFTATVRTVYRIRVNRRLRPDDYMLFFACATLIAANAMLYLLLSDLYWDEELLLDPVKTILAAANTPKQLFGKILSTRMMILALQAVTWTSIYAIKFCFLLFFHQIVCRLKGQLFLWKIILGITVLFYCICISVSFMTCTHYDMEAVKCAGGAGFKRTFAIAVIHSAMDVIADLLIVMVPVLLLWKANIKLRQKTLLGFFLCLSISMVMISLVRISGLRAHRDIFDVQWAIFWTQVEATVATITVSVTAFRQLLGIKAQRARENRDRSWYSHHRRLLLGKFKKSSENVWDTGQLPSIPGAKLTGLRTLIRGGRDSKSMTLMSGEDHSMKLDKSNPGEDNQTIQITQRISFESEAVLGSTPEDFA